MKALRGINTIYKFNCFSRISTCTNEASADSAAASVSQRQWRLVSAVCVQRFPRLSRPQTPLEQRYFELQSKIKLRRSRMSDFELEEREYIEKKLAREKRAMEEDLDAAEVARMEKEAVFEELQEAREMELQSFKPHPRGTDLEIDNYQSVNRRLDQVLYLLVKKPRQRFSWQFPQGGIDPGESLVQCAMRELEEECGKGLKVQFLSNSPVAHHHYKHNTIDDTYTGTKVFFFKAQYLSGSIKLNPEELEQFVWLTKTEIKDYVSSDYFNAIAPALVD